MRPVRNPLLIPNSFTLRKAALKGLKAWVSAWCKFMCLSNSIPRQVKIKLSLQAPDCRDEKQELQNFGTH
jgi:hypothetical protein